MSAMPIGTLSRIVCDNSLIGECGHKEAKWRRPLLESLLRREIVHNRDSYRSRWCMAILEEMDDDLYAGRRVFPAVAGEAELAGKEA